MENLKNKTGKHPLNNSDKSIFHIFFSYKPTRLKYFSYSPLDGMLVHHRVTSSIKFTGTHLYAWVERGTMRVKCLAQEDDTMSPARARTLERTNHEATARRPEYCFPPAMRLLYFFNNYDRCVHS